MSRDEWKENLDYIATLYAILADDYTRRTGLSTQPVTYAPEELAKSVVGLSLVSERLKTMYEGMEGTRVRCIEGARKFVVVPIPEHGRKALTFKTKPANQLFYLSSGTSNEGRNFTNVYFPTYGVQEQPVKGHLHSGLIQKMTSEDQYTEWRKHLCDVMPGEEVKRGGYTIWWSSCKLYRGFLDKFSDWYQVQQSAALGGEFWERPDMKYLRDAALTFSWNGKEYFEDATIPQRFIVETPCEQVPDIGDETDLLARAKRQNDVLAKYDALHYRGYSEFLDAYVPRKEES
ncbi:Hypothetical protein POVN_LOCUS157 [uncultured virus]|nr:Hypothetical protein POVN_LOCUS157 [uncultured virus]